MKHIKEIEDILNKLPQRTSSQHPESYIGGGQSKLKYIGLRVPHLRQVMSQGFSFSYRSLDEIARIWDQIWWESDCFEVMLLALNWFDSPKQRHNLISYWDILEKWSSKIDNWAHSDTLCGIYSRILEESPDKVYPVLKNWNHSLNPWKRRISIVSLLYYSRSRKKILPVDKILSLLENQLTFDHYYVQKGIGWTLREAYNVYPDDTYQFMETHIYQVSSVAFSAAIEKMSLEEKTRLKNLRKKRS